MPELETSLGSASAPVRHRHAGLQWPVWAGLAILAVYILLRLPGLAIPLDRDEGAFGAIGQMINRGGLPYRDAMDHKPPVAFYINALALHFVPATPQGVHVFILLYNLLTLVCVFFLARILFRSLSAALCCAFAFAVFSASPAIHGFTASTEMYALLPTTLSLLLGVTAIRAPNRFLTALSGVAGAAACWTKQTAFTTVLFVFLLVCVDSLRPGRSRKTSAFWLGGALSFTAGLALYFYAVGIFHDFIYWCFTYELAYTSVPFSDTLDKMQSRLGDIARGDFIFPALGMAIAAWSLLRKRPHGYFLAGYLFLSFLGTVLGYTYPHYFVQVAPAVALSGGYGFFLLLQRLRTPKAKTATAAICGLLVVGVSVAANHQYFLETDPDAISRYYFGGNPFPESRTMGTLLASAMNQNDRVLIIGSEPQILFYAGRQSATPMLMIYPLTSVHTRYKEFETSMWTAVTNHPPKYIVAAMDIPTSIAWDGEADLQIIHDLCRFIAEGYSIDRQIPVRDPDPSIDDTKTCLSTDKPWLYLYKRKT